MDDTENVVAGYSPPTFSNEGFADPQAQAEADPQTVDAEYSERTPSNRRNRRKRTSSNRRYDELVYERGTLEQQNTFLAQQAMERDAIIAEQSKQLQAYQQALQQRETETSQYFEDSLDNQEDSIIQGIKRAKEDGDIDAEVKLINDLADIKAKKTTHQYAQHQKYEKSQQQAHQINEEPYVPIETYIPQQPVRHEPVNEDLEDWMEDNSWYRTSPRLKEEADILAADLADRLAFNNQAHIIGSPEFLNEISKAMHYRYGIEADTNSENYQQSAPTNLPYEYPTMTSNNYGDVQSNLHSSVAPVTRRGISMADQYVQNSQRNSGGGPLRALTKDEFAIARHLQVRQRGEGETDLVRRFAQAKNYPKSPLSGGTPHRLTII